MASSNPDTTSTAFLVSLHGLLHKELSRATLKEAETKGGGGEMGGGEQQAGCGGDVDVIVVARSGELCSFLESWRFSLQPFHLIIILQGGGSGGEVGGGDQEKKGIEVPAGFDAEVYTAADVARFLGRKLTAAASSSLLRSLSGNACKSFGYLVSKKKWIFCLDDDCVPAVDPSTGFIVDALRQHVSNLEAPATPFFFNTLYDPYRDGADFVRGYPFSLREGVPTAISHGLWLNTPDYDANTLLAKAEESNRRYVDAVITVPQNVMYSMSSINLAFDKALIGAAMFTPPIEGLISANTTNGTDFRGNSIDDIWAGFCSKSICDHFGYGVKSGLPYVWHNSSSKRDLEALHKDNKGLLLLDRIVPFFQSLRLPRNAMTVEDCYLDIAKQVRARLSSVDPVFLELAASMEAWIEAWKTFSPR